METTKPKPFCFVLMPFDKAFDDIYNLGIKECCTENGAYCERVDEQIFNGTILEKSPRTRRGRILFLWSTCDERFSYKIIG